MYAIRSYYENEIVSSDGVFLKGNFDDWNDAFQMQKEDGSDLYSVTLSIAPERRVEYKFYNGDPENEWYEVRGENFLGTRNNFV